MPLRRCRKLSAVRSAVSSAAALPVTNAIGSLACTREPSAQSDFDHHRRIELAKGFGGDVEPGDHQRRTWPG